MRTLVQDIRYAFRMFARNPGFTTVTVLILALGIGATTAIFSVAGAVLFRPLPYPQPGRLMAINEYNVEKGYGGGISPGLFSDMRAQSRCFEEIAVCSPATFHLTGGEFPEEVDVCRVSPSLFRLSGVEPLLGRTFLPSEDQPGRSDVIILSHGLWQRRFGGDRNIVGKTISLTDMRPALITFVSGEDKICTVIGIMPPHFLPPITVGKCEMWVPQVLQPDEMGDHTVRALLAFGRLRPGTTQRQAQAEADVFAQQSACEYPQSNEGWGIQIRPLRTMFVGERTLRSLLMLTGVAILVLLIACANVTNILLARAASRGKEAAIRTTLGADRWRLIAQFLVETTLLALLGVGLGSLFAVWGVGLFKPIVPLAFVPGCKIRLDVYLIGIVLSLLVAVGIGCGLAPALQLSRRSPTEALKEGGLASIGHRRQKSIRSLLVVLQVTLTLVLLIGAALLIQTVVGLLRVDPGFEPHNLMEFSIDLPLTRYGGADQTANFCEEISERIMSLPGVQSVGATSGYGISRSCTAEGRTTPVQVTQCICSVGPYDYLRTLQVSLVEGRYLTHEDITGGSNVAINEAAARKFWPGESAIGKRIAFHRNRLLTVVGVVKTIRLWNYAYDTGPTLYIPYRTAGQFMAVSGSAEFVVRSAMDPLNLVQAIRSQVATLDNQIPVRGFTKVLERLFESTASERLHMRLLVLFGVIGLILAMAGLYGLVSYMVAQQTHEIGIRMALGARSGDVLKAVLGQGFKLTLIGIAIGLAGAFALTRVISSFLYNVSPTDPLTFVCVSLLLAGVALLASYLPARRAARIDPIAALRYE